MSRDDISDEDLASLTEGSVRPTSLPAQLNEEPTSLPRWGVGEADLRRSDVGKPVYESRGTNRLTKYPWDVWQDGKPHVVVKGHGFSQPRTRFVVMLHNRARGHDQYLASRLINDNAVEFCFFDDIGARDTQRERWYAEEVALREQYANEVHE